MIEPGFLHYEGRLTTSADSTLLLFAAWKAIGVPVTAGQKSDDFPGGLYVAFYDIGEMLLILTRSQASRGVAKHIEVYK